MKAKREYDERLLKEGKEKHLSGELASAGLLSPPAGPDTVRLMPPLTVSTGEIAEALEIFRHTLDRTSG